jgi:hypothetical protein
MLLFCITKLPLAIQIPPAAAARPLLPDRPTTKNEMCD